MADQVEARSKRVTQLPNGAALVPEEGIRLRIEPELAAQDTDGDGATNGQELGDPEGAWDWQSGDANPGDPNAVTNPGDAESFPPATAVESSTWAMVKLLVAQPRE